MATARRHMIRREATHQPTGCPRRRRRRVHHQRQSREAEQEGRWWARGRHRFRSTPVRIRRVSVKACSDNEPVPVGCTLVVVRTS